MFTLLRFAISCSILVCAVLSSPLQTKGQEMGWGVLYNGTSAETLQSLEILQASEVGMDYFSSYTLPGGYIAKGVAMRNLGRGNITISGIPSGAVVEMAFLYWAILNPSPTPAMASGYFNGVLITGSLVGSCQEPCWDAGLTHVYRADVTPLVSGNGTYTLSGFASGLTTGGNPWETDVVLPLNEGATLVIIYRHSASPVQTIVMYEGCRFFLGNQRYTFPLGGFVADPVRKATLTIFGADGQSGGLVWDPEQNKWVYKDPIPDVDIEYLEFNGNIIASPPNSPWNGGDGRPLPQLWDTHTYDVTALVSLGSKQVTIANARFTTDKYVDCIIWVGAVFGVTAKDTDDDGLVDAWETEGYDHDGNGVIDIDLPGMGANPKRKDIFVEIDYMVASDHTHKPKDEAIQIVTNAFANAPVRNPDGSYGVTLHVDTGNLGGGNSLPHQDTLIVWDGFDSIQKANFVKARRPIFHYGIFAHNTQIPGLLGISKGIPGSDFLVALGSKPDQVGTVWEQAGTFMHEHGHNIGLRHGGVDHENYKPNYLSIMNYFFTDTGLIINGMYGNFDYSRFRNRTLNESRLHERLGIGGPLNYGTRFTDPGCNMREVYNSKPIDWNWNGKIDNRFVVVDINRCDGELRTLKSFEDWPALVLNGRALGVSSPGAIRATSFREEALPEELDDEEDEYTVQIMPKAPALRDDGRLYPFPGANTTEIEWGAAGSEAITHYNIYLSKGGTRMLLGTVPASPENERYGIGVYHFKLGSTDSIHKELKKGSRYGVSAVDRYGNESGISFADYPLRGPKYYWEK